jgi:hypothetical protein
MTSPTIPTVTPFRHVEDGDTTSHGGTAPDNGDEDDDKPDASASVVRRLSFGSSPRSAASGAPSAQDVMTAERSMFISGLLASQLLPDVHEIDRATYAEHLVKDGFYSEEALKGLKEDHLVFMKTGHRRMFIKALKHLK